MCATASGAFVPPNAGLEAWHQTRLSQAPYLLETAPLRATVRDASVEVCAFRSWFLHALHVRTSHVHGIVEAEYPPSRVLQNWKAYATRKLRSKGLADHDRIIWAHGGNARRMKSPESLRAAIRYVLDGQGAPMELYCPEGTSAPPN